MKKSIWLMSLAFSLLICLSGCTALPQDQNSSNAILEEVPEVSDEPYVTLNDNVPEFSEQDFTTESFESYSELDELGRCGVAFANLGTDLMPTEQRESISSVKPSGWTVSL